jgi:RHS repeat-associated protein
VYKPFGEADVNPNSSVVNNFRFPGQYYDQETGLHYNYHRYYDPSTGRYLTPDPIGLDGGINLYTYTSNNPINYFDETGECPATIDSGWKYKTIGPNRLTGGRYQAQERSKYMGELIAASGSCDDCNGNKTLTCSYRLTQSWYRSARNYDNRTKQFDAWSEWQGYDSKAVGTVNLQYSCKQQRFIGGNF